jgi:hypothetical protein
MKTQLENSDTKVTPVEAAMKPRCSICVVVLAVILGWGPIAVKAVAADNCTNIKDKCTFTVKTPSDYEDTYEVIADGVTFNFNNGTLTLDESFKDKPIVLTFKETKSGYDGKETKCGKRFGLRIELAEMNANITGGAWKTFRNALEDKNQDAPECSGSHLGVAHFHKAKPADPFDLVDGEKDVADNVPSFVESSSSGKTVANGATWKLANGLVLHEPDYYDKQNKQVLREFKLTLTPNPKEGAGVRLDGATVPNSGAAGASYVRVTGWGFPEGSINPGNVVVALATDCRDTASATTSATSVVSGLGDSRLVSFLLPEGLSPGSYFVSIRDSADGDASFESSNCSEVDVTN